MKTQNEKEIKKRGRKALTRHYPLLFPRSSSSRLTLKHNFKSRKRKKGKKSQKREDGAQRGKEQTRVSGRRSTAKTPKTNCSPACQGNFQSSPDLSLIKDLIIRAVTCLGYCIGPSVPLIIKHYQLNKYISYLHSSLGVRALAFTQQ